MVVVVRFGLETVPEKTTANEIWYLENFSDFKTGGCVTPWLWEASYSVKKQGEWVI